MNTIVRGVIFGGLSIAAVAALMGILIVIGEFEAAQQETLSEKSTTQSADSEEPKPEEKTCDPSYPNVCIPLYPPDLNCGEIEFSNFEVIGSDPHGFDGDNNGIGCER